MRLCNFFFAMVNSRYIATQAERLHVVFGMLDPYRFDLSSLSDVRREVSRAVALVGKPDLVTVPRADAPEPVMVIPDFSQAQMPRHGGR